jgi:hypothetical protein
MYQRPCSGLYLSEVPRFQPCGVELKEGTMSRYEFSCAVTEVELPEEQRRWAGRAVVPVGAAKLSDARQYS